MTAGESKSVGTWRQVALVIDGKNVPVGPGALLRVTPEGYTVTLNGKLLQRGTARSDYETVPHQSDVVVQESPNKGQTLAQIFAIQGDVMIACVAPPGAARPTEFTSLPGSGHTLGVFLRLADAAPAQGETGRPWLLIIVAILLASLVGGWAQDFQGWLGYWYWAGFVAGTVAGTCFFTAVFLWLRWDWRTALATGVAVSVAGNIFDGLRPVVAESVGPFGAVVVSGSTAIVGATLVGMVLMRLLKLPRR